MPTNPLVTIVTPSYNQARYLEQTILSVLQQGYENLEYMVVDGGSNDGSQEIIRKYASRLAWWVSEPDRGQAEAINKGFSRARGQIVAWLNSDDLHQPGAILAAVEAFQAHPEAGLVYGDVLAVDSQNQVLSLMHYQQWGLEDLMRFRILGQPGVFMRRAVLEQAGTLDLDYHYMLDTHLWLRMAQEAPLVYVPRILAAGRFHAEAKNMAAAPRFGEESLRLVEWMKTQPRLAENLATLLLEVQAGACRMNGRYLLDGGKPWAALKSYARSFANHPPTALSEWHRMVYAGLCLVGLNRLSAPYRALRRARHGQSHQVLHYPDLGGTGTS
jgi:glycosyltransferase involved in cell wall biosynthesis